MVVLKKDVKNILSIIKEAGTLLKNYSEKKFKIYYKGDIDPVTTADKKIEKFIIKNLKKYFPEYSILSEEKGLKKLKSHFCFIIDPLDGTVNFSHHFPVFAISIALTYKEKIIFGATYDVKRDELFYASKNNGSYLNKKKIYVSNTNKLKKALLTTGFPYYIWKKPKRVIKILKNILTHAQGVRRLGAATIDLCWLACGRIDGFWEEGLKIWDTAAGKIIIEEAGGKVTDYSGKNFTLKANTIVASNGFLHKEIVKFTKCQ